MVACGLLIHVVCSAATITVCSSGCNYTTIQAAMTAANSGDLILLNVTGSHTEKDIIIPEKNLTLRGLGKTTTFLQSATTRASVSGGRIFNYVDPLTTGVQFTVENMTIRYAIAPLANLGSGQYQSIGGVLYSKAPKGFKVTFNNVKFYANETSANNTNNSGGSCIYISATGTGLTYNAEISINSCDFDDNKTANSSGSSLSDGACFGLLGSPGKLSVDNSTFTNNNSYTRGGVMYTGAGWTVSFRNSLFESNTCRNGDGGVFHNSSGIMTIENCLFKNNSAQYVSAVNGNNGYGGVYRGNGAKFKNCTFVGNSALIGGAILRSYNGTGATNEMHIINCTFYGNTASQKGKTLYYGSPGSTTSNNYQLVMANTIIANGGGAATSEIHFSNYAYSYFAVNTKNFCNSISTDAGTPGTTPVFDFTNSNTTLGLSSTLADNGGPTQTLALASNSTLINAGTNTQGSNYDFPAVDQRNYSRTENLPDIGAYEYGAIASDLVVPAISHTALTNTLSTANRVFTATITDGNGVYWFSQLTDLRPRIYFRKNSGAWFNSVGVLQSGNGQSGVWQFTIDNAVIGGVQLNDQVDYTIVTQDVSASPNITSAPAGIVATSVNNVSSIPSPNTYRIAVSLPVKLEEFTGTIIGSDAKLNWKASQEVNFSHYELQRSSDQQTWTTIATVHPNTERRYSFTDQNVKGILFYRLKSVDIDEKVSLSKIIKLNFISTTGILIAPNPVTNGKATIMNPVDGSVRLYSQSGILVKSWNLPQGNHVIDLTGLAKGTYYIKAGVQYAVVLLQ